MNKKREVIIKFIDTKVNTYSLIEYLAKKFNEETIGNKM